MNRHLDPEERRLQNLGIVARHLSQSPDRSGPNPHQPPQDKPPQEKKPSVLKRWGPIGVLLVFFLGKFKFVLVALKFAKLGTLVTMLLAVWVYAQFWGAAFAIGFILLIFVHEMGHALAMKQQGIRAGAPVFIPFVGAVIAMKEMPKNAYVEASCSPWRAPGGNPWGSCVFYHRDHDRFPVLACPGLHRFHDQPVQHDPHQPPGRWPDCGSDWAVALGGGVCGRDCGVLAYVLSDFASDFAAGSFWTWKNSAWATTWVLRCEPGIAEADWCRLFWASDLHGSGYVERGSAIKGYAEGDGDSSDSGRLTENGFFYALFLARNFFTCVPVPAGLHLTPSPPSVLADIQKHPGAGVRITNSKPFYFR